MQAAMRSVFIIKVPVFFYHLPCTDKTVKDIPVEAFVSTLSGHPSKYPLDLPLGKHYRQTPSLLWPHSARFTLDNRFLYYKYSMVTVKLLNYYMQTHPKSENFFLFMLDILRTYGRLLSNHRINLKENVPRSLRVRGTWPRAFPNSARCPPAALMRAVEQRSRADGPSARKRASAPQLSSRPR